MANRIFLIGYMGSGKTTIGKSLADAMQLPFYDTDNMIEEKEGMTIPALFKEKGEDYFRKAETDIIKAIAADSYPGIFATGGGLPCYYDNIHRLNQLGVTIYLAIGTEIIVDRIASDPNRPLIKHKSKRELLRFVRKHKSARIPYYKKAKYTVMGNREPGKIVDRIMHLVK